MAQAAQDSPKRIVSRAISEKQASARPKASQDDGDKKAAVLPLSSQLTL
jgi:hypothetical protein